MNKNKSNLRNVVAIAMGSSIFLTILVLFIGCSRNSQDNEVIQQKQMFLTTSKLGDVNLFLVGEGDVVINWGKGEEKTKSIPTTDLGLHVSYTYSVKTPRTIIITGNNITGLICIDNELTSLNVSKNPALQTLFADNNQLTSLDVRNNKELIILNIPSNRFSGEKLSELFQTLPKTEMRGRNIPIVQRYIDASDNPGSNKCNAKIAQLKGWTVFLGRPKTDMLFE